MFLLALNVVNYTWNMRLRYRKCGVRALPSKCGTAFGSLDFDNKFGNGYRCWEFDQDVDVIIDTADCQYNGLDFACLFYDSRIDDRAQCRVDGWQSVPSGPNEMDIDLIQCYSHT